MTWFYWIFAPSVFWQALWALVRLLIANIVRRPVHESISRRHRRDAMSTQVGKFAQLLQSIGRQRMSEVEQQGRRAVLVYY